MTLVPLAAGPLTMVFDTETAFLRYITLGTAELVRGVFAAVRDHNWDTLRFVFEDIEIDRREDSFSIRFVAKSQHSDVKFQWVGTLHGSKAGVVSYRFEGTAAEPFLRNRIGLCVLHPGASCAGLPCHVEHVGGSTSDGTFPKSISPHQPFKNIRSITHPISEQLSARVTLVGDVFEMEDQRNWTDDSFKTYSTPLEIPFPVEVEAGSVIEQAVTIEVVGMPLNPAMREPQRGGVCQVQVAWNQAFARPAIGFGCPPALELNEAAVGELRRLKPDHLRVDIRFDSLGWQQRLVAAMELAGRCTSKLELALFATPNDSREIEQFVSIIRGAAPLVARLLLFHPIEKVTSPELLAVGEAIRVQLDQAFPIVAGTDAYFAELNRGRPKLGDDRMVCYSVNPQVHAFDNHSLRETLQAQQATIDSAVALLGSDVVISPVTLRPRFNPNATAPVESSLALQLAIDPRQRSGFAAAWTLGALASMACHVRLRSLTFYEACGPRGVMGEAGERFAMTELFESVLDSKLFFRATSDLPLQIVALASQRYDGRRSIHLGNLGDQVCQVQLHCGEGQVQNLSLAAESIKIVTMKEDKHA